MFVFEKLVLPLLDRFQPEALIIQGGADALVEDPMSRLCLSNQVIFKILSILCLLYTSPSPRDGLLSRMPSSA